MFLGVIPITLPIPKARWIMEKILKLTLKSPSDKKPQINEFYMSYEHSNRDTLGPGNKITT